MTKMHISNFFVRNAKRMKYLYWFIAITLCIGLIAIPIALGIINPHVRLPDIHGGPPSALVREWNLLVSQARREQTRINDFVMMVDALSQSYPFMDHSQVHLGMDYTDFAWMVFDDLIEVARYDITPGFFSNFLHNYYLQHLGGYGNPRLTSEPATLPVWMRQPYFFNEHDWRFNDERTDITVYGGNIVSYLTEDGATLNIQIIRFLPHGYELVTRNPFWYFDLNEDARYLNALFGDLYGVDDLVIDIRGIGSGFGNYFLPLLLEPLAQKAVQARFYAFHTDTFMANRVSARYREFYNLGNVFEMQTLTSDFLYQPQTNLVHGFPLDFDIPLGDHSFEGQVWLLTDSDNFSGPNFMYLQLARDAGFHIIYEFNPYAVGWDTSFIPLPHTGLALRFNPLFFTDAYGRSLEVTGVFYDSIMEK